MDPSGNHNAEDVLEEQSFTTRLPEWARERAEGQWYEPPAPGPPSRQARPRLSGKLIVVVPDEGKDDWAKARVFDNSGQATALVQTLVEGGLAPEQVSIFSATQLVVDVAYRPVVELKRRPKREKSPDTA
jgi:hypothetical protein